MKRITQKIPAKINLTLDVLGVTGGFHDLESMVASIDVYDKITVTKRTDRVITLKCKGLPVDCAPVDNNAYRAAKLFMERFNTTGVNIVIEKNIPVGGGLGGSSADIVGVLKCMQALFEKSEDLTDIANDLGSDCAYMLNGGFATMRGRGDKVEKLNIDKTLYLILIPEQKSTSARLVYKAFDDMQKSFSPCTALALKALNDGDMHKFLAVIKNDLTDSALSQVPEMNANLTALKKAGAPVALMTGSGSCVYALFENEKQRNMAYKKLKNLYGKGLIKAKTII